MSKDESQEEMEEVQADLKRRDEEFERKMTIQTAPDLETGIARSIASRKIRLAMTSHVFWEALSLTFLAEWGDRSQLATIILGARENVTGVTFGGILGHSICTAMAVVGGRFIASKISPRQGWSFTGLFCESEMKYSVTSNRKTQKFTWKEIV